MVKRNISFYERKKEIITKTWILRQGKVHIMNFLDEEKVNIMDFWE